MTFWTNVGIFRLTSKKPNFKSLNSEIKECQNGNFYPLQQHSFIKYNGLEIFFNNLNQFKMKNLNELSQPKRSWLVAEVKISYHNQSKASEYPKINTSTEAELILRKNWSDDMELLEEFNALFLNRANGVKGFFHLSRGGVSNTYVDLKILFSAALKALAPAIILAHNHPSGNLKPSQADIELTKKFQEAGKLLDIQIIDHLILIPNSGYYSFADEGNM